jgi:hypothetical protein
MPISDATAAFFAAYDTATAAYVSTEASIPLPAWRLKIVDNTPTPSTMPSSVTISEILAVLKLKDDPTFNELVGAITAICYGELDAELPEFLVQHGIVPDTPCSFMRHLICAYLIRNGEDKATPIGDATATFSAAYDTATSAYASTKASIPLPAWRLKIADPMSSENDVQEE